MRRRVQAAKPAEAGYPTLRALLGLAAAAPIALASATALGDATVPEKPQHPPSQGNQQPQPKPPEIPIHLGGKVACPRTPPKQAPAPRPQPKRDPEIRMKGEYGYHVRPAEAPRFVVAEALDGEGIVIHPHGPDEPCHPRGRST